MYLNDLTSAKHNVEKLNRILADSFNHEVDLSSMNMDSLNRMLNTTEAKMMAIKESDLKYWENPQYNKLGLIQHQLKTYINEVAPTRTDGKKMKAKTESVVMEDELEQAEVLLAAQELVDELQKMVEDIAEMQVQKLMPIVDAMKEQVGFEQAEAYNNAVDAALGALLDQSKAAKESVENATLAARGEAPATPMPTDMGMDAEDDMDVDVDMSDDFEGDDAAAGEDNAIGRELKGEMKEALDVMEAQALKEKKFLEAKDRIFQMLETGQITKEQFLDMMNEFDLGRLNPFRKSSMPQRPKPPRVPAGSTYASRTPGFSPEIGVVSNQYKDAFGRIQQGDRIGDLDRKGSTQALMRHMDKRYGGGGINPDGTGDWYSTKENPGSKKRR